MYDDDDAALELTRNEEISKLLTFPGIDAYHYAFRRYREPRYREEGQRGPAAFGPTEQGPLGEVRAQVGRV